jgi:hypothetical protein
MKKFPNNFKQLVAFPGKICHCHRRRLTCASIFEHENFNFKEWFKNLVDAKLKKISKKMKQKLAAVESTFCLTFDLKGATTDLQPTST